MGTTKRRSKADAVQEELEFMRQLEVYPEVPADLVLEEFEAYRLLLRRYEPQTTATTVTKLVGLLSTQFAGDLLDCVTDFERRVAVWEGEAGETAVRCD